MCVVVLCVMLMWLMCVVVVVVLVVVIMAVGKSTLIVMRLNDSAAFAGFAVDCGDVVVHMCCCITAVPGKCCCAAYCWLLLSLRRTC